MNTDEHRFKDFGQTDLRLGELRRVNTEILRCVQDDSIAWKKTKSPDRRAGLLCRTPCMNDILGVEVPFTS
jgi:hypothetical protein